MKYYFLFPGNTSPTLTYLVLFILLAYALARPLDALRPIAFISHFSLRSPSAIHPHPQDKYDQQQNGRNHDSIPVPDNISSFHYINRSSSGRYITRTNQFFAEEAQADLLVFDIVQVGLDENSIYEAAGFLVDAFWLNSRHLMTQQLPTTAFDLDTPHDNHRQPEQIFSVQISECSRQSLLETQANDLTERYAKRMGRQLLDNGILMAIDRKNDIIVGLVCVSALLFDTVTEELLLHEDSERLLKSAVASLVPREQGKFKDASAEEIVSNLFGGEIVAVCCISNLAVAPRARRHGIAAKLVDEAERLASVEWGYDAMLLKVEADNTAARNLYEQKLYYRSLCTETAAAAFRVDAEDGRFVESEADTLILAKDI